MCLFETEENEAHFREVMTEDEFLSVDTMFAHALVWLNRIPNGRGDLLSGGTAAPWLYQLGVDPTDDGDLDEGFYGPTSHDLDSAIDGAYREYLRRLNERN